jgi:hypothetical protein
MASKQTEIGITNTIDAAVFAFVQDGGIAAKLNFRSDVGGGDADKYLLLMAASSSSASSSSSSSSFQFSTGDYLIVPSTGEAIVWVVDRFQVFPYVEGGPVLNVAGVLFEPRSIPLDAITLAGQVPVPDGDIVDPSTLSGTSWDSATYSSANTIRLSFSS